MDIFQLSRRTQSMYFFCSLEGRMCSSLVMVKVGSAFRERTCMPMPAARQTTAPQQTMTMTMTPELLIAMVGDDDYLYMFWSLYFTAIEWKVWTE